MKILIVGSDFGTIDMVHEAHKQGDYVVVADYYESTPTKDIADEAWTVSTMDIDALEKMSRERGIEAVTFAASDLNVTNGRLLAKRLGLPCYCDSDIAWSIARNKSNFKDLCQKIGAPTATRYHISEKPTAEELERIVYPVVVKPVDCSANRGMSYCDNEAQLLEAIKYAHEISKNPTLVIERKLHGPEFVANYVLADGKAVLNHFCSEHHQPGEKANLYSIINTTSWHLKDYLEQLNDYVIELFKRAEFKEGIAWVECMLDDDGHFYLLEPGYRFCGEMTAVPYGVMSNFNGIKWMLDIAKGVKHKQEDLPVPLTTAHYGSGIAYHMFANRVDELDHIEGLEEIAKIPNVVMDLPHKSNFKTRFHGNIGIIRFPSFSKDEIIKNIEIINKNLYAVNSKGENLFIRYTDVNSLVQQYEQGLADFGLEVK